MKHASYRSSTGKSDISASYTKVDDFVSKLDRESIRSIVVGVREIFGNMLNSKLAHTSLLLSKDKARDLERNMGEGILIEYGYYLPDLDDDEKYYVRNGYVIYRYGDDGGLRYYMQKMSEFVKTKGTLCYVCLDIDRDDQITFSYFLDKIAPKYDYEWTNKKYHSTNMNEERHNCQTFVARALNDFLKPIEYDKNMVIKGKEFPSLYGKDAENKIPEDVLKVLKFYENF